MPVWRIFTAAAPRRAPMATRGEKRLRHASAAHRGRGALQSMSTSASASTPTPTAVAVSVSVPLPQIDCGRLSAAASGRWGREVPRPFHGWAARTTCVHEETMTGMSRPGRNHSPHDSQRQPDSTLAPTRCQSAAVPAPRRPRTHGATVYLSPGLLPRCRRRCPPLGNRGPPMKTPAPTTPAHISTPP